MPQSIVKRAPQPLVETSKEDVPPLWKSFAASTSFIRFSHTYSEVKSDGVNTTVKSTATHLTDGKLSRESFEGTLPAAAFDQAVQAAQAHVLEQTALLMRPWWSVFARKRLRGGSSD